MRLSVTQIRIAILVLNLFLTAMIGVQTWRSIVVQTKMPELSRAVPDATVLRAGEEIPDTASLVPQLVESSRAFLDAAPVAPPTVEKEAPKTDEIPLTTVAGEEVLTPGPLGDEYEYVTWMGNLDNPWSVRAVLQKKDASAAGPGGIKSVGGRTPPRPVIRSPGQRSAGGRAVTAKAVAAPTDKIVLRFRRSWKSDDDKYRIWVVEVSPERLVYENALDGFKRFALTRASTSIYDLDPESGTTVLKAQKEEVDPNAPEAKEEKAESHFKRIHQNLEKEFEERKLAAAGAVSPASAASPGAGKAPTAGPINSAHPANAGPRPPSAEEIQKLRETMSKIPKKDQELLEKALSGRKK